MGMPYPMYSDIFAVCCEGRRGVVGVSGEVVGAVSREMARVGSVDATSRELHQRRRCARSLAKRLS